MLAQPLIEDWISQNRGVEARLQGAASDLARALERLPETMANVDAALTGLAGAGIRIRAERANNPDGRDGRGRESRWALWAALLAIAVALLTLLSSD
jgi:hypothetical protein